MGGTGENPGGATDEDERTPHLPWRRELPEIRTGLGAWGGSFRSGATVSDVRLPGSGMANDTVLFRLDGRSLVARLAPAPGSPYPTFPTFDLAMQQRVIELVRRRTEVPVPEVVHFETSEDWLGSPFLVLEAVEGSVASDNPPYLMDPGGWFLQGTAEQRTLFELETVGVLARIHDVDEAAELAFLVPETPGDTMLERQLASQRGYYEWARDGLTVPVLERALDALTRTLPPNDRTVLNWGDSRPGNIIYRDFRPVAVLDWEMATVGPPEVDLGWITFFQRFFAHLADQLGLPPVPAMFQRKDVVSVYEQTSGTHLEDLAWYEAFAGLRFGIILTRMSLRNVAFGVQAMPENTDDLVMFAPLLEDLTDSVARTSGISRT